MNVSVQVVYTYVIFNINLNETTRIPVFEYKKKLIVKEINN